MGGDGGVIASNRRYMRGAGTADHTGDYGGSGKKIDPAVEREETRRIMTTCAVSGQRLNFTSNADAIVTCPYGWLYRKEAAVEALLQRKQQQKEQQQQQQQNGEAGSHSDDGILGGHIRGLKDLYEVRFHVAKSPATCSGGETSMPTCPIMGTELNGNIPAIALVPGKASEVNVVSERSWKEMGEESMLADYGPLEQKIRLAPPPTLLKQIQSDLERTRKEEQALKKSKKLAKKRKRGEDDHGPRAKSK